MDDLGSVQPWVWALLGALVLVQLSLMIWALVDVIRRPDARIRGPKWLWAVIIVFGELVGPIVYLVFARLPETVDVAPQRAASDRATAAADALYGSASGAPAAGVDRDAAPGSGESARTGDDVSGAV